MDAIAARIKIAVARHALEVFTHSFAQITDGLPVIPPELNRAHYLGLECLSHLNHALDALEAIEALRHPPDAPTSHKPPQGPTTPGLEPSPPEPA